MSTTKVVRWSGLACIGFSILLLLTSVTGIVLPETDPANPTARYLILETLRVLTPALGLLAIAGLYAGQVEPAGKPGLVGYLLAFSGVLMVFGLEFSFAYLFPVFAIGTPEFVAQLDAGQVEPGGPIMVVFILVDVVFLTGFLLFGIATLRAGVFPRAAATLMLAGAIALAISDFLPDFVGSTSELLMGLGFAWLGYALWAKMSESTGQAAAATAG